MADEKKKGYPKIPRNNWFLLREKFKQRTPERVSPSYVASALSMSEASASANIIPPLRSFGLIDDTGKPSDLAYDWRDDSKYDEVCRQILKSTYPQELMDLYHDASAPAKNIEGWFARNAKVGQAAARAYAATYRMLLEADLTKAKEQNGSKTKVVSATDRPGKALVPVTRAKAAKAAAAAAAPMSPEAIKPAAELARTSDDGRAQRGFSPKLHVDIQIHISPDSSPEQIDKIFESMAKHLPFKS